MTFGNFELIVLLALAFNLLVLTALFLSFFLYYKRIEELCRLTKKSLFRGGKLESELEWTDNQERLDQKLGQSKNRKLRRSLSEVSLEEKLSDFNSL